MPASTYVSPFNAIIPIGTSQSFSLANPPSSQSPTWTADSSSVSVSSSGVVTVNASASVGQFVTITATLAGYSPWTAVMTVGPTGSLALKNTLICCDNGLVYLITESANSVLSSAVQINPNGDSSYQSCPEAIWNANNYSAPWGSGQSACSAFANPGVNYLTCVVVNLPSAPVGVVEGCDDEEDEDGE